MLRTGVLLRTSVVFVLVVDVAIVVAVVVAVVAVVVVAIITVPPNDEMSLRNVASKLS